MAALTRGQYAETVHRKLDDLATDLSFVGEGDRTEGDYTDAIDSALRDCGFTAVSEADLDAEVQAIFAGVEYYALTRLLYKNVSKPTTQQGAGTSGLHLMVQTESLVRSLRLIINTARENYKSALRLIGRSLEEQSDMKAGAVTVSADDAVSSAFVIGDKALPWFQEGYYES
jgi:hypothetical protein